ncbi:Conserved_hypothetical protein [Hexamita inflata]|uniref:Uncharacterized protein n=1 Tax=Hexamita inflata TaxID=28002 RepID=A0AA86U7U6_9EUKA|nr:Conserved hypothetical protein [Hexamita inflata]
MIFIQISFLLRCFQQNTTVVLDVQTREAVLKAWPREDVTKETELCEKLKGYAFELSIETGAYEYSLQTPLIFDPNKIISIKLPCAEVALDTGVCASAFQAKSAIYTMNFKEIDQNVIEVVYNLRRLDFNRKACFINQRIEVGKQIEVRPGVVQDVFKFIGNAQNCKYPVSLSATITQGNVQDQKATISFFGYPNYNFSGSSYSFAPDVLDEGISNAFQCSDTSTNVRRDWCSQMVQALSTQSYTYFQINVTFPGLIPNRDGTITREINYTMIIESNEIRNVNLNYLDCFKNQTVKLYRRNLRLITNLNKSMIQCAKLINQIIDFDYFATRIIFKQYSDFRTGEVHQIDFKSSIQVLNATNELLPCIRSSNETQCYEILAKRQQLLNYYTVVQKIFYKNDQIINILPLQVTCEVSVFSNMSYYLYDNQVCATFNQSGPIDVPTGTAHFTFSFGDDGINANNQLNITTMATFPNKLHKYCADYNFTQQQLAYYKNEDQRGKVSGQLSIDSLLLQIPVIFDMGRPTEVFNVKYIIIVTFVLVAVITWLGLITNCFVNSE